MFQHRIAEMRFFEGAFQWYYIDSSPTFIPYIKVLQTDHFGEILETIGYWGFEWKKRKENWPPPARQGAYRGKGELMQLFFHFFFFQIQVLKIEFFFLKK